MRGRSLRLDPADPQKVASNWDVVCVAPDLVRGSADYERFVRKHLHLYAPAEDGEVEAGPSHVHPELAPFAPPPVERFRAQRRVRARAADRDAARERWRIGEPYRGVELPTLLVRRRAAPPRRPSGASEGDEPAFTARPGDVPILPRPRGPLLALRLAAARAAYPPVLPLDRVAQAIVAAYVALGAIRPRAGAAFVSPAPAGTIRCALADRGRARERAAGGGARGGDQPCPRPALRHRPCRFRPRASRRAASPGAR